MQIGNFYFLNDSYFIDFTNEMLMSNKETARGTAHDRPCFYAIYDENTSLYWLIPISSKIAKFKSIYQKKMTAMANVILLHLVMSWDMKKLS